MATWPSINATQEKGPQNGPCLKCVSSGTGESGSLSGLEVSVLSNEGFCGMLGYIQCRGSYQRRLEEAEQVGLLTKLISMANGEQDGEEEGLWD